MKVNPLLLMVIPLLVLSGPYVNAGPVGDFFKKVGQSISKPLQPQPEPPASVDAPSTYEDAARHAATHFASSTCGRRDATRSRTTITPSQRRRVYWHCAACFSRGYRKAKAGLPYGIPVPGRKGMVTSPYLPEEDKYIDVTDFASGSVVKDPYTGKFFLVP